MKLLCMIGSAAFILSLSSAAFGETDSTRLPMSSLLSLMEASDGTVNEKEIPDGFAAFRSACTQCHDAERSTSLRKTYESWLLINRRMADKSGANIPESQIEPIAAYLASLYPEPQQEKAVDLAVSGLIDDVKLKGAVSILWRNSDAIQENKGFQADVWFGAEWRSDVSPVSLNIMACTSCHESGAGLELVEGSISADLIHLFTGRNAVERKSDFKASVKAGRLVVPFGAFSDMVHPGTYKTMTYPLMYSMGRSVGQEVFRSPVLPMPYSDEGIDFHTRAPLPGGIFADLDLYAVNGLQPDFYASREYSDNNSDTALGGRATLGNAWLRFGGSYSSGEMQYEDDSEQTYELIGGDVTLRYRDWVRLYYEYAVRKEDFASDPDGQVDGHVAEIEARIWKKPRISMVFRYDTIDRSGSFGNAFTERVSWGPTMALGGTLLILNHEHWMFDSPSETEDIIGFRWSAWF